MHECSTERAAACVLARMSGCVGGAIAVSGRLGVDGAGAPIGVLGRPTGVFGAAAAGVPGCEQPNRSV